MAIEIVDLPSYKMGGSFQFAMLVYQRVNPVVCLKKQFLRRFYEYMGLSENRVYSQ